MADPPAAAAAAAAAKKVRPGAYTTVHPHDAEAAGRELLEKLRQFVAGLGGSLGDGWRCEAKIVTVSDAGDSGTANATYYTPSGKRMRSRGEVAKFLGLEVPTGKGARGGGGGGAAPRQASGAHEDSPAAAAAAAGGGGNEGRGSGGGMSRAEAYTAALARATALAAKGVALPLTLKNGVVVESLGAIDRRLAFNTTHSLMPLGYTAVYRDAAVGAFVSSIRVNPEAAFPQFVVTLEPSEAALQEVNHRGHSSSGGAAPAGGGGSHVPGLAAAGSSGQAAAPAAAPAGGGRSFQLAEARNADQAWAQVVGLQERAKLQVEAAAAAAHPPSDSGGAPAAAGAAGGSSAAAAAAAAAAGGGGGSSAGGGSSEDLDPVLAALLARAANLGGCWGKAMFGLNEVHVLQLMEALPSADATNSYQFVDERGGWGQEAEFLAKGRWARRSTGANKRPPKALAVPAAGGGGGGGARSSTPTKKRPAAAAAAGGGSGDPNSLFGAAAAPKRYK
jgi:hypothetical protein